MTLDELRGRAVATAAEAAPLLRCSERTVHRLMAAGEIPSLVLGRRRLIPVRRLLALLGADPPNKDSAAGPAALSESSTGRAEVSHG